VLHYLKNLLIEPAINYEENEVLRTLLLGLILKNSTKKRTYKLAYYIIH